MEKKLEHFKKTLKISDNSPLVKTTKTIIDYIEELKMTCFCNLYSNDRHGLNVVMYANKFHMVFSIDPIGQIDYVEDVYLDTINKENNITVHMALDKVKLFKQCKEQPTV